MTVSEVKDRSSPCRTQLGPPSESASWAAERSRLLVEIKATAYPG